MPPNPSSSAPVGVARTSPSVTIPVAAPTEIFNSWRHDVANALTIIFLTCEQAQLRHTSLNADQLSRILQAAEEIQLHIEQLEVKDPKLPTEKLW